MNIGLLFGSFNPIHIGHLAIANYFHSFANFDKIWLIVSPQNPLKSETGIIPLEHRVEMAKIAIGKNNNYEVLDFEKSLPIPSYTYQSLNHLSEQYPQHTFHLIIGGDNIEQFEKWKNWENILDKYHVIGYPRPFADVSKADSRITIMNAPNLEISSSFIRNSISNKKEIQYFLPYGVYNYLIDNKLYNYFTE